MIYVKGHDPSVTYKNVCQAVNRAFELFPFTLKGGKVFCRQEICPEKAITLR